MEWAAIDGQRVLEIGPGRQALTRSLAARAGHLYLVEIDPKLAADLRDAYAADDSVTVIEGDVLALDLQRCAEGPLSVVSNLPYESGTAIVSALLELGSFIQRMVVMLQLEVCRRLLAGPGSRDYGVLSVMTSLRADIEPGMRVPPESFRPPPKVDSQVVRIRPLPEPRYDVGDSRLFGDMVNCCFGQRRKMIGNTFEPWLLSRTGDSEGKALLERAGIDPRSRPETVSLEALACLSRLVSDQVRTHA